MESPPPISTENKIAEEKGWGDLFCCCRRLWTTKGHSSVDTIETLATPLPIQSKKTFHPVLTQDQKEEMEKSFSERLVDLEQERVKSQEETEPLLPPDNPKNVVTTEVVTTEEEVSQETVAPKEKEKRGYFGFWWSDHQKVE